MWPGSNSSTGRLASSRAFTLIEVLLVLGIFVIIAGLFMVGASDFFRAQQKTMPDVFWDAVQGARLLAVESDQTVELRYDDKQHRVHWGRGSGFGSLAWPGKGLEFLPVETRDTVLIGGQLRETTTVKSMKFFPDGTAENYRIQLIAKDGRISYLEIDPWTCAAIDRTKGGANR